MGNHPSARNQFGTYLLPWTFTLLVFVALFWGPNWNHIGNFWVLALFAKHFTVHVFALFSSVPEYVHMGSWMGFNFNSPNLRWSHKFRGEMKNLASTGFCHLQFGKNIQNVVATYANHCSTGHLGPQWFGPCTRGLSSRPPTGWVHGMVYDWIYHNQYR